MIRVIDLSHNNGHVDLSNLMKYKPDAFAFKCTEGTSFVDPMFADFVAQAQRLGVPHMAYMYGHPESSAAHQVDLFLSHAKPVAGMALANDLERGTTQKATNAWARSVGTLLRDEAPQCKTALYMGHGYASSATGAGMSHFYDWWWYPRYPSSKFTTTWPTKFAPELSGNTTGWAKPLLWQWTQTFASKYDANISTATLDELLGGDVPLSDDDIAKIWAAPLASKRTETKGKEIAASAFLTSIDVNAANNLAITNAVNAAIPGITQALIDALPAALAEAVVQVDVSVNGKATS